MTDVLMESLEAQLTEWEESINEGYKLIKDVERKKPEAVKAWNASKIDRAIGYYRDLFGEYPSKAELSHLTGLDPKTVDRIIMDKEFNFSIRAMKKTSTTRKYKKVGVERVGKVKIPILALRKSRQHGREGRPHIRYVDSYNGMPKALAFYIEVFSRASELVREKHPELIQDLEDYLRIMDEEEKRELARIKYSLLNPNYLPEVTGAIAHQIIKTYAYPSTGKVYIKAHDTLKDLTNRMADILKAYAKHAKKPVSEEIQNYIESMNESLNRVKALAKFAKLTKKKGAEYIALAFDKWMNQYGRKPQIQDIRGIILKAGSISEVTVAIFDTVKEQVTTIVTSMDIESVARDNLLVK